MAYRHLFFDLDHTLWDFDRNSEETLLELYREFDLGYLANVGEEDYLLTFKEVNRWLWDQYNHSKIDKEFIRSRRFELIFGRLGVPKEEVPPALGDLYLQRCPQKPHLLPHSKEILDYLAGQYTLHILTNGFNDVQHTKLRCSGIREYFQTVVTSECTGHKKPSPEIFGYALQQARGEAAESLMIGDSLDADIEGAHRAGIDSVFYNPDRLFHQKTPRYEIRNLLEMKDFL
jgi:putative hydrolase of the HAD superfamily